MAVSENLYHLIAKQVCLMPVYFFTGKLGSGKTLMAIERIDDALRRGVRVASNIDLNLIHLLADDNVHSRVARVPDKPSASDLNNLGLGYVGDYDEKKAGLLVLDELGTWLNSRSWNDKARRPFIDWCIHARKYRWDLIFIVQDVSMVDAQIRSALCEFLVRCRRTDRMKIPMTNLSPPKVHVAGVYYGDDSASEKNRVETIMYRGTKLFAAYDTEQCFVDDYPHGTHSLLQKAYFPEIGPKAFDGDKNKMKTYLTFAIIALLAYWIGTSMYKTYKSFGMADTSADIPEILRIEPSATESDTKIVKEYGFPLLEYVYRGYLEVNGSTIFLLEDVKLGRLIDMVPASFEEFGMSVYSYDLNTLVLTDVNGAIVYIDSSAKHDSGVRQVGL